MNTNTINKVIAGLSLVILLFLAPLTFKAYVLMNRVETIVTEVEDLLLFQTKEFLKQVNTKELGEGATEGAKEIGTAAKERLIEIIKRKNKEKEKNS